MCGERLDGDGMSTTNLYGQSVLHLSCTHAVLTDKPDCRFLLVLIPSGPSAMLLANVAELVEVDQGPIAGYLTISVSLLKSCESTL